MPGTRPSTETAGARLGELFRAHGRVVYGLCVLLLRDPHEAEDAAQQTFLSAYRSLLGGTEPRKPVAWLAQIARNECRARIAARMREPLPVGEEIEVSSCGPDEAVGRRLDGVAILRSALRELPEHQREAVVLRDLFGLSYEEVGAALGVSSAAVDSLLVRGRRRLQERIGPSHPAAPALLLPLSLGDSLSELVPGFGSSSAGSAIVGSAVTGVGTAGPTVAGSAAGGAAAGCVGANGAGVAAAAVAKLAGVPLLAKVFVLTIAVGAAGTTSLVESGLGGPHRESSVRSKLDAFVPSVAHSRSEPHSLGPAVLPTPAQSAPSDARQAVAPGSSTGKDRGASPSSPPQGPDVGDARGRRGKAADERQPPMDSGANQQGKGPKAEQAAARGPREPHIDAPRSERLARQKAAHLRKAERTRPQTSRAEHGPVPDPSEGAASVPRMSGPEASPARGKSQEAKGNGWEKQPEPTGPQPLGANANDHDKEPEVGQPAGEAVSSPPSQGESGAKSEVAHERQQSAGVGKP